MSVKIDILGSIFELFWKFAKFLGAGIVLVILLFQCSSETDKNNAKESSSLALTTTADPAAEAAPKALPELLDPDDPTLRSVQLSSQGKEILDNLRALRSQALNGFKLGKIVVGKTTIEEAALAYPKLDLTTSKMQPADNISFPLSGEVRFSVDDESGRISGVVINSPNLDLWEKHQLDKQLPLERFQLKPDAYQNKISKNTIAVYVPPNMSSKWATKSIPSIEIAKLRDSGQISIRIDWPVFTRQKWLKINNSHRPLGKKIADKATISDKVQDYFN